MTPTSPEPSCQVSGNRAIVGVGVVIFLVAGLCQLAFWQASEDAAWPYPASYKGDAPLWLAAADAGEHGQPFEFGLPLRPPGTRWLVGVLYHLSDGAPTTIRAVFLAMTSTAVALLALAAARSFGVSAGWMVGLWCSGSTALLSLASSPNSEAPYLLLVALALLVWPNVHKGGVAASLIWGGLGGLACLVRVEHLLFLLGAIPLLLRRSSDLSNRRPLLSSVLVLLGAGVVLTPWQLHAWAAIDRFNGDLPPRDAPSQAAYVQLERQLPAMTWAPPAQEAVDQVPAFARRPVGTFIAATVAWRGRRQIEPSDLRLVDDAFGVPLPSPLPARPFVALYGPLNFALANSELSDGGFSRRLLSRAPPLAGGAGAWPPMLVQGLPPNDLALVYPPHLHLVTHGYQAGFQWIRNQPTEFLHLVGKRLGRLVSGATAGLTGFGLPVGLSGTRHPVDMVTPGPGLALHLWRALLLALAASGLWRNRRNRALDPWLLLIPVRLVAAGAFFGYARHGALLVPVVALLAVLPFCNRRSAAVRSRTWILAGSVLVALELARLVAAPDVWIDGRRVLAGDPDPSLEYRTRSVSYRFGSAD